MNKKTELRRYRLLKTIRSSSKSGNKKNMLKYWKGTSKSHFMVMSEIFFKLINQGYEVYSEVIFNNSDRADLVAISPEGMGTIIEILQSETKSRYEAKLSTYPIEWDMIAVKVKDFDIEKFNL